jgi:hypothetical protein
MAWLGDREFWVNLIGFASIASAAIFGLLALFTDYKKDGKVTHWGRLYAGGIALSAVFAMTSAVLQKRIAADERADGEQAASDQRDLQKGQFDTQLRHLTRLNGHMERVNAASTDLLNAQRVLLASAQQGMLLTSRLGVQERENTGRVIQTLWYDANRIRASSLEVEVSYDCWMRGDVPQPHLFDEGDQLLLGLTPAEPLNDMHLPLTTFQGQSLPIRAYTTVLTSSRHEFSWQRRAIDASETAAAAVWTQHTYRYSFAGRIGDFENPDTWRGAAIEILVTAPLQMPQSTFEELFVGGLGGADALRARFPGTTGVFERYLVPCHTGVYLIANGHYVAHPDSGIVLVRNALGSGPILVLKAHAVAADVRDLPRFAGRR